MQKLKTEFNAFSQLGLGVYDFKAWLISAILESCYEKNGFDILFTGQRCLKKKGRVTLVCFDNLDMS